MKNFAFALVALCLSVLSADARCRGIDLRYTLNPAEKHALSERIAATPYAEGNLWKATRADKVIYLIGTIHIHDARLNAKFDHLKTLVEQADMLLLEATEAEEAALKNAIATRPELIFLTDGPTLPEIMEEQDWQALMRAVKDRGIPPFMAAKFQPWYLSVLLSLPPCAMQSMAAGQTGLDGMLGAYAKKIGTPQAALESYETLFQIMNKDSLEQQVHYLSLGTLPADVAESGITTTLNSYFDEATAESFELSRITMHRHIDAPATELDTMFDNFFTALLDDRNRAWIPKILNTNGNLIVVAAGAGHLPGENGLAQLLENEGFTLTRLPF